MMKTLKQISVVRRLHYLAMLLSLMFPLASASHVGAQAPNPIPACAISEQVLGTFNVKCFGARGDGTTDDTRAVQAAATAAQRAVAVIFPAGATYMGSGPSVYFPPGIYRLTKEIAMGPYTFALGEGHPILRQDCVTCRILVWDGGYTAGLSGLKFVGGSSQVYYANANIDTSRFDVTDSEFQLSSDFAIYTKGLTDGHLSALVVIQRSKFFGSRILRNVADWTVFRDNWVTATPPHDSAAFENRSGILMIENMLGVPGNSPMNRWIDNYDSLYVNNTRFGGEDGGIPIVHHFLKPGFDPAVYPFMGPSIVIENSWCFAGNLNRSDRAVVTLRSAVPNIIKLVGNTGPVSAPYVHTGDGMNIPAYLARIRNAFSYDLGFLFQVEIGPNAATPFASAYEYSTYMPNELKPYLYNSNRRNIYNINHPRSLTISGAISSGLVTFAFVEPDANYGVMAIVSATNGTPAAGATRVYVTNKTASGFTINLEAAPGMGNSVTVDWHLVR